MTEAVAARTGRDLVARAHDAWRPFRHGGVAGVGLNGLRRQAPSGWTFGGLVAHVSAWHELAAERFERYGTTGEMPGPPDDTDAFNARAAEASAGERPTALLDRVDRSWDRLASVVEPLTEVQVDANDRWAAAVFAVNTWEHYDQHRDELRSVRPRTVDDLLARYRADWPVFRDAVERLTAGGKLEEAVSDAWRMRDIVAHATGWLVEAVEVIPEYVAGRPRQYTGEGIDRQNAANVASRRERSHAEVIAELDAASAALVDAIGGLRDEDLSNPQTLGIIGACSYLHWDEHLVQLGADV